MLSIVKKLENKYGRYAMYVLLERVIAFGQPSNTTFLGGSGLRIEDNNNNKTASLIFHKRIQNKTERNAVTVCQERSGAVRSQ